MSFAIMLAGALFLALLHGIFPWLDRKSAPYKKVWYPFSGGIAIGPAKPKHLDVLAEALRVGIARALSEDLYVVDQAGENVLYLSIAVSNLKLTKKKKKAFQYLPVALVVSGVKKAATTDIAKMADLKGLVFELEAFDSVSGERLVAIIDSRGEQKNPSSWEELEELMALYGGRLQCRLDNAKLPPDQQVNCLTKK